MATFNHKSVRPSLSTATTTTTRRLNGGFGVCLEHVCRSDLKNPQFQRTAYNLWLEQGGLLVVRGDDLVHLTPQELLDWSSIFGKVQAELPPARQDMAVPGYENILRIGNVKDENGKLVSQFTNIPALTSDADVQYNPDTQRPVWHTDGTFQKYPPIGSVFHCRQTPPGNGGATLFADTAGAYKELSQQQQQHHHHDYLERLEAICSLAHHDQKVHKYSPEYPTLTAEQRAANPPNRVPLVLQHPVTGKSAIYGLNSSTCAIVLKGQQISTADLDTWDLQGTEDESVQILRKLLPFLTSPSFTIKWTWQKGDIVVWDNRCTIHAATGFDHEHHVREMWRVTLVDDI